MVLPSARWFTELGIQPREELTPLQPVDELLRDVGEAPAEATADTENAVSDDHGDDDDDDDDGTVALSSRSGS